MPVKPVVSATFVPFLFYRGWVRESRYVMICLHRFCDDSLVWNFQGGGRLDFMVFFKGSYLPPAR